MPDPAKILVVQPSWVGDAVMATPTLRAIRQRFPDAHISYLMKRYVKHLYSGMPWAEKDMGIVLHEADLARLSLPMSGTVKETIKGLKIRMGLGLPPGSE